MEVLQWFHMPWQQHLGNKMREKEVHKKEILLGVDFSPVMSKEVYVQSLLRNED